MSTYCKVGADADGGFRIQETFENGQARFVADGTIYPVDTDISALPLNENIIAAWASEEFTEDVPYVAVDEQTTEEKWAVIRATISQRLAACGWTQASDVASSGFLTAQQISDWSAYRQALLDIPTTYAADPDSVEWPSEPA